MSERNEESWLRGIHPQPLCPFAKTKIKFVPLQKSGLAKARQKEKHTSYNKYPVTAFIKKSPLKLLSQLQLCRGVLIEFII
ncbi:MAG TPA: hypothetical protein DCS28_00075 [Candidatus Moranbacteria bacterium]|nr:hypothetical protein [Candidatus Moranbacteria bacterium]HAT74431.1 hypothetical protein [Candidatus Moranbacteria bacterium]